MKSKGLLLALLPTALFASQAVAQDHAAHAAHAGHAEHGTEVAVDGGSYTDLAIAEYQEIADNPNLLLINVHIPFEGDLPDTDASIAFNEISEHIAHVAPDKDAEIVLYCRSGRMSTTAATELVKLGYTRVHNLVGGMNAWVAAGLPLAAQTK